MAGSLGTLTTPVTIAAEGRNNHHATSNLPCRDRYCQVVTTSAVTTAASFT